MGRTMGEERFAAHEHGRCMVVCRAAWGMAVEEKRRKAKEEFVPRGSHHAYRMGYECTPAELGAQHTRALRLWIHAYGGWGREDRRDRICAKGSEFNFRYRR